MILMTSHTFLAKHTLIGRNWLGCRNSIVLPVWRYGRCAAESPHRHTVHEYSQNLQKLENKSHRLRKAVTVVPVRHGTAQIHKKLLVGTGAQAVR